MSLFKKSIYGLLGFTFLLDSTFATQVCDTERLLASTPIDRFVLHGDRTLTDTLTGLMWQQCLVGQGGADCGLDSAHSFSWAEALIYSGETEDLGGYAGHMGWRVPNIRELESIVELQCGRPAINLSLFPNNGVGHLWSSSPYRFYPHYSWYLDFEDGVYIYGDRTEKKHIRLVRDSKNEVKE